MSRPVPPKRPGSIMPTVIVVALVVSTIAIGIGWHATVRVIRKPENADAIVALAAVAQVIFGAALAYMANRSNHTAMAGLAEAREQSRITILPAVTINPEFDNPAIYPGGMNFTTKNDGFGPALEIWIGVTRVVETKFGRFTENQELQEFSLRAGEEARWNFYAYDPIHHTDVNRYTITFELHYVDIVGGIYERQVEFTHDVDYG